MYGASIDQQVACATHGFDEASCGSKLWYFPMHKVVEPPDDIIRLVFPSVLDVSDDPGKQKVLDVVSAAAWVRQEQVCIIYSPEIRRK